ncbi:Nif3-like dinuclear metal center hexameric protein [Treponema phagedenis]|uniref:Nif3-like dinuclear metal center hexameric protein n=1 Tax=Treponema phagedenis TaxID=162 RepID=UPI0001F637BF|nr:Nif3-like dinuclear metal center hexameric protein [Treponema phagedenis]EFW36872.1 dinuclear metal center protein, YbgI family [Treponema phagedenis F0421]TYT78857.1 Nif3-like dinuclear metal center hexameric protein [Treponema phagedenis]
MTSIELDAYFNKLLNIPAFDAADPSQNGLQVDNSGKNITKVAFAVDACLETIMQARERGAGMLFVHHGLFWGSGIKITGAHYHRIKTLMDGDLALYAVHLPLDAHPEYGNNSGLAKRLQLQNLQPFGEWRGMKIGLQGHIASDSGKGIDIEEAVKRLFPSGEKPAHVLPFGKKELCTAGIISGGAADEIEQAIDSGLDLFITGEIEHVTYHTALENRITVIAGGHYQTETVGVGLVAKKLSEDFGIETFFIDVPTGM